MWTRKQLKERGKKAFTANYWKCLLVALIFAMIAGGGGSGYSGGGGRSGAGAFGTATGVETVEDTDADTDEDANDEADDNEVTYQGDVEFAQSFSDSAAQKGVKVAALIIGGIVVVVIVLLVFVIASVVSAFVLNPFELGCCRFFYRNLDEPAKVSNVAYAFDNNYMNLVKNLFFRDLYVMLWSLLFIIPGIVKAYEYRMIPYILQDNPEMSKDEVFASAGSGTAFCRFDGALRHYQQPGLYPFLQPFSHGALVALLHCFSLHYLRYGQCREYYRRD